MENFDAFSDCAFNNIRGHSDDRYLTDTDLRLLGSVVMLAEVRKCSERVAAVGPEDEVKAFAWNSSNLAVFVNVELITAA